MAMKFSLMKTLALAVLSLASSSEVIIGGQGAYQYVYNETQLQMPTNPAANPPYSHGLEVDGDQNIYLTYYDSADPTRCLVRWSPKDGYVTPEVVGKGTEICSHGNPSTGPHGLRIAVEDGKPYFYHANNNQALFKTTLDGKLVWQQLETPTGTPAQKCQFGKYCPTWFGQQPGSEFVYMADGYGASQIHVYTRDGNYTGHTFGGKGTEHGKFQTPHAISWDPRRNQMVVSDRANHRLEYFNIDPSDATKFEYAGTTTVEGPVPMGTVCNARFNGDLLAAPTLEGFVFILDKDNKNVATINVKELLGDKGFNHPHDAIFLPNGDIVVATWNPGRIGYWRKLPTEHVLV